VAGLEQINSNNVNVSDKITNGNNCCNKFSFNSSIHSIDKCHSSEPHLQQNTKCNNNYNDENKTQTQASCSNIKQIEISTTSMAPTAMKAENIKLQTFKSTNQSKSQTPLQVNTTTITSHEKSQYLPVSRSLDPLTTSTLAPIISRSNNDTPVPNLNNSHNQRPFIQFDNIDLDVKNKLSSNSKFVDSNTNKKISMKITSKYDKSNVNVNRNHEEQKDGKNKEKEEEKTINLLRLSNHNEDNNSFNIIKSTRAENNDNDNHIYMDFVDMDDDIVIHKNHNCNGNDLKTFIEQKSVHSENNYIQQDDEIMIYTDDNLLHQYNNCNNENSKNGSSDNGDVTLTKKENGSNTQHNINENSTSQSLSLSFAKSQAQNNYNNDVNYNDNNTNNNNDNDNDKFSNQEEIIIISPSTQSVQSQQAPFSLSLLSSQSQLQATSQAISMSYHINDNNTDNTPIEKNNSHNHNDEHIHKRNSRRGYDML